MGFQPEPVDPSLSLHRTHAAVEVSLVSRLQAPSACTRPPIARQVSWREYSELRQYSYEYKHKPRQHPEPQEDDDGNKDERDRADDGRDGDDEAGVNTDRPHETSTQFGSNVTGTRKAPRYQYR